MELGFSGHAEQVEWAQLVDDFAAATTIVVATVNVEDIHRGIGQGGP